MGEHTQDQLFESLLSEYFPRDAVQVMEDVRSARDQRPQNSGTEADALVSALLNERSVHQKT